ncbi:glycoside hydrolase family 31 protein [Winogradskya consettensis]|uniref:Alpha-xylosidase n=1 Tax=Winogradskya consettensis TaxID=113560 RepID=A0A919VN26_9ACTN|nr:TIM-barrel domain-containing protein [Actinoplanes consettensis]GIM69656.1 alpha-xylosidase [Actinoplanes consettensis]
MHELVRRRTAAAASLALVTGGLALVPPTSAQATAKKLPSVVSGDARFQVISPTLIRTEYAPGGRFTDGDTFNVIGRDDFTPTRFTKRISQGWLSIDTGAATLRYKVGSGAFTADNLTVRLKSGRQSVAAAPWEGQGAPDCAPGTLCEAEALALDGPSAATDHGGYTGQGFAAGFEGTGNSLSFAVTPATAGTQQLTVRYANSTGGDGQNVARTLTVTVDGTAAGTLTLPPTGSWDTWALASAPLTLTAGRHQISLVRTASDSGSVNIDSLAVLAPGAAYPAPTPPSAQPCAFGAVCEADAGTLSGGARLADDHNGYSGDGFVAGLERTGAASALTVTGVPAAGTYQVQVRYANAQAGSQPVQTRTATVTANDAAPVTVTLPPTSSWDYWRTASVAVRLKAGTNTVTFGCPTDQSCNVNVDTIAVTAKGAPLLAPHAPLGGYRRGLDNVNGGARTYGGLLYQDGWSLVDDSASAPHRAGVQDGYVFAYGQDYRHALRELSTLTGPTKLLPKWAYGVWYSEYFDRTAAEFQDIVARFKTEGVPLDSLVVDTDFKAPDKWNGWSIDPTRFPDWTAFAAALRKQGVHTGLNIHPSILGTDPAFPKAQELAKGKLKKTGCNGGPDCYVFDFGDADQLKAYLWLHDQMGADGVDFWWLDWCCDASTSTEQGVTADAWINQKYADLTGFAFSRAYGSLQAGGYANPGPVATGPWADKRTTLHFTGDTISNWETLRFEVGYTPGESAATGLAAVSHDIGGHTGGLQEPGSEPGSTKLPDDLYARWVQMGTFQPIDRLHSNHSDRLPWQYGAAANASAKKFLNLRKKLQPYTYAAAAEATRTGTPIVRAMYLAYPGEQEAYATAGSQYLYGPDLLVAPVTTPGTTASTSVWFPPGNTWTDYFTGKRYKGGTTASITTTLDTMPVFVRSGAAKP